MTLNNSGQDLYQIIQDSIKKIVLPNAKIVKLEEHPIKMGFQSVEVFRHKVVVQDEGNEKFIFLVTKKAELNERLVLKRLYSQSAKVPFNFSHDTVTDSPSYVCMQDIDNDTDYGNLNMETIGARIPEVMVHIHASNYLLGDELTWLPFADKTYISNLLQERWKVHWDKALKNTEFHEKFQYYIPEVKAVATKIIDDMEKVLNDETSHTLIHTDIHPGNILSTKHNEVYFIDWAEAHYGTFYLDVPICFNDLKSALRYHQLLASRNIEIPPDRFEQHYRIASRYIGLRYMAWTFGDWRESGSTLQSLYNYLNMVVG